MLKLKKVKAVLLMWVLLLSVSPFKAEAINAGVSYSAIQESVEGFSQSMFLTYIGYNSEDAYNYHPSCKSVSNCYWSIGFVDEYGFKVPYIDSFSYAQANKLVFNKGVTGSKISVKDIVVAIQKNMHNNIARLGRRDYERFQRKLCIGIFITPNPNVSESIGARLDPSLYACSDGTGGGGLSRLRPLPRKN